MDEAGGVCVRDRVGDIGEEGDARAQRQRSRRIDQALRAVDQFHCDPGEAAVGPAGVDRCDAGMAKRRERFGFADSGAAGCRVCIESRDLERNLARGIRLTRAPDFAHAARADLLEELEAADRAAGNQKRMWRVACRCGRGEIGEHEGRSIGVGEQ